MSQKIGLALSGGGFRATLYHLGVVRFLRDAGALQDVTDIASVSQLNIGDVTYPVTVTLDDTDLPLRWGMTVEVDIDTET